MGDRAAGLSAVASAKADAAPPITHVFSERFECRRCSLTYEDPQPRLFSFNNPFGACPTCHGFGNIIELDMDLVVPGSGEVDQSGRHRAVEQAPLPFASRRAEARGARRAGSGSTCPGAICPTTIATSSSKATARTTKGIRGFFRWLERKKYKVHVRVFLSRYRGYLTCPDCGGTRLRREARDVRVGGLTIDRVSALTVREAQRFFADARSCPRRKPRSPTRCSRRSGGVWDSWATSVSTI